MVATPFWFVKVLGGSMRGARTRRSGGLAPPLPIAVLFASMLLAPQVLWSAGFAASDLAAARALRARALAGSEAWSLVESLTTEVGPRLAGTPGDAAAVAWAQRELVRLGFANVRTQEVIVPRWVRGTGELAVLAPFPQDMPAVALGGSVGTPDEGLRAPAIRVQDVVELQTLPRERVAGRIVYFAQRTAPTRDASGYGRSVRSRVEGPSAAASLGALAVVIRSIGTSNDRFAHTGAIRYTIDAPRIPAVSISNPDADALDRQFARGGEVRLHLLVTARDLPQTRSANVTGEIPGSDPAGEIVLLGAHLDSWDLGTGALDDGAGVAIVMAAAKLIEQTQPRVRRTIRVVLFANEEFGLSGANAYAALDPPEIAKHAIAMEADLGAGPVWQLSSRVPEGLLPRVREMQRVLAPLGVALGNNEATGGADLGPLRRLGVPVLAPQLDASVYFEVHHTANDTLDKVDRRALDQSVAAFAVVAYLAARSEESWGRIATPEALPATR
jgi:hypothetical protein